MEDKHGRTEEKREKKHRKSAEKKKKGQGMQNESKNRFLQRMLSICLLLEEGTEGGGLWPDGSSEVSQ